MNIKIKAVNILISLVTILLLFCNCTTYAREVEDTDGGGGGSGHVGDTTIYSPINKNYDPTENPSAWKPTITLSQSDLMEKASVILSIINVIGVVISVIIIMIIGIKYMLGSVEEKASYKQEIVPYLIGALFLFGSTTIANIIYKFSVNALYRL